MGELVKSAAWPIAITLMVFGFFIIFRTPISALISRTKSISVNKDGVSTQGLEQQKAEVVAAEAASTSPTAQLNGTHEKPPGQISEDAHKLMLNIAESPALTANVEWLRTDLESRGFDLSSEASKILLRYCAAAYMWLRFENAYLAIFGSQIKLLKAINESKGRPVAYVDSYVAVLKLNQPELATWTTDQYILYLINYDLMRLDGEIWRLTPLGSEFLVWMARLGRSEERAY